MDKLHKWLDNSLLFALPIIGASLFIMILSGNTLVENLELIKDFSEFSATLAIGYAAIIFSLAVFIKNKNTEEKSWFYINELIMIRHLLYLIILSIILRLSLSVTILSVYIPIVMFGLALVVLVVVNIDLLKITRTFLNEEIKKNNKNNLIMATEPPKTIEPPILPEQPVTIEQQNQPIPTVKELDNSIKAD